jgi:hypothetical protein
MSMSLKLGRFKRALQRRVLVRPNALYYLWLYGANARRTWRARRHRPAFPEAVSAARELKREGIIKADASAFLTEEGVQHFVEVKSHLLTISNSLPVQEILEKKCVSDEFRHNKYKNYLVSLISPNTVHSADRAIIQLALDPKLLEIVASYLGLWPKLDAVHAWLNFPTDEPPRSSQLWHRDPEDLRLVKAFIYLVDVDEDTGPFTYIPKTHPFGEHAGMVPDHKDRKRVLDEEMNSVLSPDSHLVCTGPADTMILADTVGYHRGGKPRHKNRILLTFTYTSGWSGKRRLRISGKPPWSMNEMQRMAM